MKKVLFIQLFTTFILQCYCQKPVLDTSVFRNWEKVGASALSSDGKYIAYEVLHISYKTTDNRSLTVTASKGGWKKTFPAISSEFTFSSDSKRVYFQLSEDTLAVVFCGTDSVKYIKNVKTFQVISSRLIYNINPSNDLIIESFVTGRQTTFKKVESYFYNEQEDILVLNRINIDGKPVLTCYRFSDHKQFDFAGGENMETVIFDHSGKNFAFVKSINQKKSIYYYHVGDVSASLLFQEDSTILKQGHQLDGIYHFSDNDRYVLFWTRNHLVQKIETKDENVPDVSVWRYSDPMLKSEKDVLSNGISQFFYSIDVRTKQAFQVNKINEDFVGDHGNYAIISQLSGGGSTDEVDWNPASKRTRFLVDLRNGSRIEAPDDKTELSRFGNYLLYYNMDSSSYFTVDVLTGKKVNITRGISTKWTYPFHSYSRELARTNIEYSFWLAGDSMVVLSDFYDIWLVDPKGVKESVNLTNGYGLKNEISFFPIEDLIDCPVKKGVRIVLSAFDYNTKKMVFLVLRLACTGIRRSLLWMTTFIIPQWFLWRMDSEIDLLKLRVQMSG